MTAREYWERRAIESKVRSLNVAEKQMRQMRKIFKDVQDTLLLEIENVLGAVGGDLGAARQMLSSALIEKIRNQYMKLVESINNVDSEKFALYLIELLNNSNRLTRLDSLLLQVDFYSAQLYGKSGAIMRNGIATVGINAYYHRAFDLEQFHGREFDFSLMDSRKLDILLNTNWSGKHWSERLWGHVEDFDVKLKSAISKGVMLGQSVDKMAIELGKLTNSTQKNAQRIVRTETAFVAEQASAMMYEELDVEKYRFLSTLDLKTSSICRSLDGEVFLTTEAVVGENYPPLHPNCRSTTVPEIEGMETAHDMRTSRDVVSGKTMYERADMTYKEWHEKRVNGVAEAKAVEKTMIAEVKAKNAIRNNHAQYERYKERLKNAMPSEYDFKKYKLENKDAWKTLQEGYKNAGVDVKNGLTPLTNINGKTIIKVDKSYIHGVPNSITQVQAKKGGISRNYYDENGRQTIQISNNDHGENKDKSYGKNGEHAHDYVWDNEKYIGREERKISDLERKENGDIL